MLKLLYLNKSNYCVNNIKTIYVNNSMSSSRSVSAARARRASETPAQPVFKPSQQQQRAGVPPQRGAVNIQSQPQMKPYQPQPPPQQSASSDNRLSVSDAFALVTIRLGRVELLLQKWQEAGVAPGATQEGTGGASATSEISNTIVRSIISRIDDLERNVKASVSTKDLDAKLSILNERNAQLQTELREAKDTIYKLQSMTLDTSQKIMTMMMPKSTRVATSSALYVEEQADDAATNESLPEGEELEQSGDEDQPDLEGAEEGEASENLELQVEA
jgi:hypothetical protein